MVNLNYKIEFFDYWSTDSGLSGGALADNLSIKDKKGLPYLPGKTIKGLFRESADLLSELGYNEINQSFINEVFGEPEREETDTNKDEKTIIAKSFFTNAVFNEVTASQITTELTPFLFEQVASTALEKSGMAKKNSLRRIEYALPCTLYGQILDVDSKHKDSLISCGKFIKRLGLNRHHGFGRCKITFL